MVLRDFFRRPSAVTTREALEDFLDGRAAFVTQKAIFEYSRAAAGYLWQPLFDEDVRHTATDHHHLGGEHCD